MTENQKVLKKPHPVIRVMSLGFLLLLVLTAVSTLFTGLASNQPLNFGFSLGSVFLIIWVIRRGPSMLWSVLFVVSAILLLAIMGIPGYKPNEKIIKRTEAALVLHEIMIAQKATQAEVGKFYTAAACPAGRTAKELADCDWQAPGWRAIEYNHEPLVYCSYACYAGDVTDTTYPGATSGDALACAASCDTDGNGISSEFIFVTPSLESEYLPDWTNKLRTGHGMLDSCKRGENGCPIDDLRGEPNCDSIVRCTPDDVY